MPAATAIRNALNLGERALQAQTALALAGCDSVLDVGCGTETILERVPRPARTVGLDGHAPAIEASRARNLHDEYVHGDAATLPFDDRSMDAVIAFDVIEHLPAADGRRLLAEAERVARRVVVIFTPNGWVDQDEYAGNPLQVHRSGWHPQDFAQAGYRVLGMKGLRSLRAEHSQPRRPQTLSRLALSASQPVVEPRPSRAYALLAIKTL